jgi:hypothetical protein
MDLKVLQDILGHASIEHHQFYARLAVRREIPQVALAEPSLVSTTAFIWVFSLARGFVAVWFGFMRWLFFAWPEACGGWPIQQSQG